MKEKPEKKKFRVGAVIFRIILILVAGLTVGLAVFSFNANRIGGNQLPMPFGYGASVVLSGSMEPALAVNDLVFVEAEDDYDVGDVVVYQNGKDLIIHRVVKKDGEDFVTRGDANNADDDPILLEDIKGKMIFKIPFIGLIFKWLKTLPGTLIVLGLAIFLLYRSRRKEKDRDIEQLDEIVQEIQRLQALQQEQQTETQKKEDPEPAVEPKEDAPEVSDQKQEAPAVSAEPSDKQEEAETPEESAESDVEGEKEETPAEEQTDPPKAEQPDQRKENSDHALDFSDIDALISEIESDN